ALPIGGHIVYPVDRGCAERWPSMRAMRDRPLALLPLPQEEAAQVRRAHRDPGAFAPLYAHYAEAVYSYCYRRLGDPEAAADATSVIFTRALTALPRYQGGTFRRWLFAIAPNAVIDGWRTAHPSAPLEHRPEAHDPAPGPEEVVLRAEAQDEVRALLEALPCDQRQVVELRLAGLTTQEIAQTLGRSVAACKMLQLRAMTRLRTTVAA